MFSGFIGISILAIYSLFPMAIEQVDAAAEVRASSVALSENYFSDIVVNQEGNKYYTTAQKIFSSSIFNEYDLVSSTGDFITITYEVIVNSDDKSMTLNIYIEATEENIIENFKGYYMTNYNDEMDVIFNFDGIYMFLSELEDLTAIEQCSIWGNLLHFAINADLFALSVIEPAITIMSIIYNPFSTAISQTTYGINYAYNILNTQPTSYVTKQSDFTNWKFGMSTLAYAGCEVISGYNLSTALGKNYSLAYVTYLYEALGIEIGAAQGYFGSNPYQISYFLIAAGIEYEKVISYSDFYSKMTSTKDYYVILSRWNGEETDDMIHTFMLNKTHYYTYSYPYYVLKIRYRTYNMIYGSSYYDKYTIDDLFTNTTNNSNTFIVAYFIEK